MDPLLLKQTTRTPEKKLMKISVASLLMHPLMVEILPFELDWRANTVIPRHDRYSIGVSRGRQLRLGRNNAQDYGRISDSVNAWFAQMGVGICVTKRALLDTKLKRYWSVDFVCEIEGQCCLVCLFHGGRKTFAKHEIVYAERLMRIAKQNYFANVKVIAIKVWGRVGQMSTWELGSNDVKQLHPVQTLGRIYLVETR